MFSNSERRFAKCVEPSNTFFKERRENAETSNSWPSMYDHPSLCIFMVSASSRTPKMDLLLLITLESIRFRRYNSTDKENFFGNIKALCISNKISAKVRHVSFLAETLFRRSLLRKYLRRRRKRERFRFPD